MKWFLAFLLSSLCLAQPKALHIIMEKWPGEVHPAKTVSLEGVMIGSQVYETLVHRGAGGQITPGLAEHWSYDSKKQTMHLTLRRDVLLSNGERLTSAHVRKTFEGIISHKVFRNLDKIHGAKTFAQGKSSALSGFHIKNDREFTVHFDFFYPRFLEELADPYAAVYVENQGLPFPLGTGAYEIEKVNEKSHQVFLKRNPHSDHVPSYEELVFMTETDPEADISFVPPLEKSASRLSQFVEYFDTEVYFLGINGTDNKLTDPNIRASLAAVLTGDLVDKELGKIDYPIGGFIPLGVVGHESSVKNPVPKKPVFPKGELVVWSYMARLGPVAEAYCQQLKKMGVSCRVETVPVDKFFVESKKAQLFFARQKSTSYSPEYLMSCFSSNNYSNIFAHGDSALVKKLDHLFDRIQEVPSSNEMELVERYKEMDQAVMGLSLVKPFRYGANKKIWHRPGLSFPSLSTLGPFNFKFAEVR